MKKPSARTAAVVAAIALALGFAGPPVRSQLGW